MAGELKNTGRLTFSKAGADYSVTGSSTIDVTGFNAIKATKQLSTSDYNFDKGNVGTIGRVFVLNLDTTNNVIVGADGTNYPIKIKPGSFFCGEWNAAAVHAKSSAGTPYIDYVIIED